MGTPRAAGAPRRAAVLGLVGVLVAGCGGRPEPGTWAVSVCQALAPWRTTIANLTRGTEGAERASEWDVHGRARRTVERLGTAGADEFSAGVRDGVDVLNREYGASALDTRTLDSPELQRALDEVPECR
jgi:hypothetical protein